MKPLIVANWKCNPTTLKEAKILFNSVGKGIRNIKKVEVVICPPFVYIPNILHTKYHIHVGAQDCSWAKIGAYTGEVSPLMLKNMRAEYVILGHSERRRYLKEQTELVNQKIKAAIIAGLKVIFCVGSETKKPGKEMKHQLEKGLAGLDRSIFSKLILMYEPVWAISTTKNKVTATPEEALRGSFYMRKVLEGLFGKEIAKRARIIYGGSVDSKNVTGFLKEGGMVGTLVGAASLRPGEFIKIVKKVDLMSKI